MTADHLGPERHYSTPIHKQPVANSTNFLVFLYISSPLRVGAHTLMSMGDEVISIELWAPDTMSCASLLITCTTTHVLQTERTRLTSFHIPQTVPGSYGSTLVGRVASAPGHDHSNIVLEPAKRVGVWYATDRLTEFNLTMWVSHRWTHTTTTHHVATVAAAWGQQHV